MSKNKDKSLRRNRGTPIFF